MDSLSKGGEATSTASSKGGEYSGALPRAGLHHESRQKATPRAEKH